MKLINSSKYYLVDGIRKLGAELTYDDVKLLYYEYYKTYGEYPKVSHQKTKYNVPHSKILARVLKEENITLNDFQNEFGVFTHVRSNPSSYNIYLEKYLMICNENGVLGFKELLHNHYGLPTAGFFIRYCPDKSVNTYWDFVRWCGFETFKKDKNDVIESLINLEKRLGRPIKREDITLENVGFSMIVIVRIWGSLDNCKRDLGLKATEKVDTSIPFEKYKEDLDLRLDEIKQANNHNILTWADLEDNVRFETKSIEHHTALKKFKENNLSFLDYITRKGFVFNLNSYGHSGCLENGEKFKSKKEADFSLFLQELGFVFNETYFRDIMYKTFCQGLSNGSKINCDYVINYNGNNYYVEIAGILISEKDFTNDLKSEVHIKYRDKMINKKELLEKSNINYLFIYSNDFEDGTYKEKTMNFLGIKKVVNKSLNEI